jgi:hypothetical protein
MQRTEQNAIEYAGKATIPAANGGRQFPSFNKTLTSRLTISFMSLLADCFYE